MNNTDNNPNYKKIYQIVKDEFLKTELFFSGPFDETYYSLRVHEMVKEIIEQIKDNCKVQQILVAAILHDIGKIKLDVSRLFDSNKKLDTAQDEWNKHPKLGVPIAKEILEKLGHSEEFIDEVCYLIANHDQRGEKLKIKSLELKILQDADLIADCGFAGFIRPFLYGSKFQRSVIGVQ
ncbi:MAG: HD domain-containing protein [Nanoarchaeota archaeon]|nr:HD domain-containing protein [Nanoarchaeota archaeon]MBU1631843.1 HD domain-containing protein [Nanoarchaeota archaeon]MBU1875836.1 HD domain-containing protein [Nanoarchaeota archaeon]